MISGLEATADSIMAFEGWKPGTRSYVNRNPGNLRLGGTADDKGYSIFPDMVSGYSALMRELRSKFSGENSHSIGPDSSLLQLFNVYAPPSDDNPTNLYCDFVAGWLSRSLGRKITSETLLKDIWSASLTG